MAYTKLNQQQIIAREQAIVDECAELKRDPHRYILDDRAERWKEHVADMTVRPEIQSWAALMATRFGKKVRVHHNATDWVTALMIIRYGEAEYHWPGEFSDDDVRRAKECQAGKFGETVELMADE